MSTQGLAWGADIRVVPVSSLQSTAQVAASEGVRAAIVALDARMGEVYCGRFRLDEGGLMQAAGEEMVFVRLKCLRMQILRAGPGLETVLSDIRSWPSLAGSLESVHIDTWPSAGVMIPLAQHWLQTHEPLPANQAQPVYLRDKVASKTSERPS